MFVYSPSRTSQGASWASISAVGRRGRPSRVMQTASARASISTASPRAVGGRYDGLLARLDGPADARAVGCMVRPWRAWTGGEA